MKQCGDVLRSYDKPPRHSLYALLLRLMLDARCLMLGRLNKEHALFWYGMRFLVRRCALVLFFKMGVFFYFTCYLVYTCTKMT